MHQALLLADTGDDLDGSTSLARHLKHHVSAYPGLPWYQLVIEGALIHIDHLLAVLDELSHLKRQQLLILRNLKLQ